MIIFVLKDDEYDITRDCKEYDSIYNYLLSIGIKTL